MKLPVFCRQFRESCIENNKALAHGRLWQYCKPMTGFRSSMVPRSAAAKSAAALVCLALFIFVHALGSSHLLHRVYHADADDSQHQCAVTLLASGHILAPIVGSFLTSSIQGIVLDVRLPEQILRSAADRRLQPERAPPLFSV